MPDARPPASDEFAAALTHLAAQLEQTEDALDAYLEQLHGTRPGSGPEEQIRPSEPYGCACNE